MSIQLSLNGHSFCVSRYGQPLWLGFERAHLTEEAGETLHRARQRHEELRHAYRRVRVVVDTDRACLVPTEYERAGAEGDYLRVNEIPFRAGEDSLQHAREHAGIVGLICVPVAAVNALRETFPGAEIAYTHPLLLAMRRSDRGPVADICLSGDGFAHLLVVPDKQPAYAATVPYGGTDDLLFALSTLNGRFKLADSLLLFSGTGAVGVRKEVSDYFRHTALDQPFSPTREMKNLDIPFYANVIRAAYENY